MLVTAKVEPPLESMSRSFIDVNPGIIKYDVKHTHVVTIGNIRKKMEAEPGTKLKSETFIIKFGYRITAWCISIYPNGHSDYDGSIGHIGVRVHKRKKSKFPINAEITLSIMDRNGLKSKSQISDVTFHIKLSNHKFISHLELQENPDLIPDDTLTIMVELTVKGGGVSLVDSGRSNIIVPCGNEESRIWNYIHNVAKIFHDGKFPDVTIVCQGREFPCHKAILAGRSPVFEAMFSHSMKEKIENQVEVVDIDADTFAEMLEFIYSSHVALNSKVSIANLLVAAEKYNLVDLKKLCEERLCVQMSVNNVLDMMELADLHNAANLRAMALKFIGRNAKEVASQKEWRERFPDVVVDIIDAIIQK